MVVIEGCFFFLLVGLCERISKAPSMDLAVYSEKEERQPKKIKTKLRNDEKWNFPGLVGDQSIFDFICYSTRLMYRNK